MPDESPAPEKSPHGFSRLGKWTWAIIGVFAAFGIFLIGLISSGGKACKDKAGNATTCSSGGHGSGGAYVGGTSSTTTARGGFGSTGAAHAGGGE